MPIFTYDGFSKHIPTWEEHILGPLSYLKNERTWILDIGPGEGASTLWFLNNLADQTYSRVYSLDGWHQKETEKNFDKNIAESELSYKVIKVKGNPLQKINELCVTIQTGSTQKFNIIYVNCTTMSLEAMSILLNAFYILKDDGVMIINNNEVTHKISTLGGNAVHYREVLGWLRRLLAGRVEIIHSGKQLILKKINVQNIS